MTDSTSSAQPAKSSPFPWILGGCGCLLFGIGIVVAGIFMVVMQATEEPEKVVKEFLASVEEEALGEKVLAGVNPGQQFIHVVYESMVRLMGLFVPVMREVSEMMYQSDRDYVFDSTKFERRFGAMEWPAPTVGADRGAGGRLLLPG